MLWGQRSTCYVIDLPSYDVREIRHVETSEIHHVTSETDPPSYDVRDAPCCDVSMRFSFWIKWYPYPNPPRQEDPDYTSFKGYTGTVCSLLCSFFPLSDQSTLLFDFIRQYTKTIGLFGEDPKQTHCHEFFGIFAGFLVSFAVSFF